MLFILFLFLAQAKITDPEGIYRAGRLYCSHANTVFVIETKDKSFRCNAVDFTKHKTLWTVKLPFKVEPDKYNENLERDVQLCIVQHLMFEAKNLLARDCTSRVHVLDPKDGKWLKSYR
jgi:hypothetical protein